MWDYVTSPATNADLIAVVAAMMLNNNEASRVSVILTKN